MEPTGSQPEPADRQPDEVTQAALDTVAEATDLADEDQRGELVLRKRALRRVTGRLIRRSGGGPGDSGSSGELELDLEELSKRPERLRSVRRLGAAIGQV